VMAWLMITSTGMSHASGALLPSTTLTMVWLWAARAYLKRQFLSFVIWAVVATLAIGWPFGVLLFVPLGLACLVQLYRGIRGGTSVGGGGGVGMSSVVWLLCFALGIAVVVQGIVSTIDYMYYDRWVSPVYNILRYNTHAKGDELYGVEPTSYYIKNLVLNFNYVAVVGVMGGPVLLGMLLWRYQRKSDSTNHHNPSLRFLWDLMVLTLPMYVWLGIVVPRPHKEERFLFPIYPILCLGAAMVGNAVVEGVLAIVLSPSTGSAASPSKQQSRWSLGLQLVLWTPAALLGGSRTVALTKYYTAPFHVYAHFQKEQPLLSRTLVYATIERGGNDDTPENSSSTTTMTTTTVCTCGEWYRFPSSFYLPSSDRSIVNFKFVSPSPYFEGQLPHAFLPQGSGLGATYTPFNDQNMPEYDDRYVPIDACDYLVDATWGEVKDDNVQQDASTPSCRDNDSQWLPIITSAFLDADRTTTLHRILYLPKLHEQADLHGGVEYVDYVLYRRIQGEDDDDDAEDVEEEDNGAHSSPHT
jgi:alpha-1,2-mannosyltransferase